MFFLITPFDKYRAIPVFLLYGVPKILYIHISLRAVSALEVSYVYDESLLKVVNNFRRKLYSYYDFIYESEIRDNTYVVSYQLTILIRLRVARKFSVSSWLLFSRFIHLYNNFLNSLILYDSMRHGLYTATYSSRIFPWNHDIKKFTVPSSLNGLDPD